MTNYEIFDPCDGLPIYVTRWKPLAAFLSWLLRLDYDQEGEDWIDN